MFKVGDKVTWGFGGRIDTVLVAPFKTSKGVEKVVLETANGRTNTVETSEVSKVEEPKYLFQVGDKVQDKKYPQPGPGTVLASIHHNSKEFLVVTWTTDEGLAIESPDALKLV